MATIINFNNYRKAQKSSLARGLNLIASTFTATAVFSLLISELAPSNPSQFTNNAIQTNLNQIQNTQINQIQNTEISAQESDFQLKQLDDISSTTNTMMLINY